MGSKLVVCCVLFAFVWIFWHSKPPASINGEPTIPTKIETHWWRNPGDVTGTITGHDEKSGEDFHLHLYRGFVSRPEEEQKSSNVKISYHKDLYLLDPSLTDFSLFSGFYNDSDPKISKWQTGVSWSPVRILNDFAPNIMVTPDAWGFGMGIYYPTELSNNIHASFLDHLGLEIGHMYNYRGGGSGNFIGLTFSTYVD